MQRRRLPFYVILVAATSAAAIFWTQYGPAARPLVSHDLSFFLYSPVDVDNLSGVNRAVSRLDLNSFKKSGDTALDASLFEPKVAELLARFPNDSPESLRSQFRKACRPGAYNQLLECHTALLFFRFAVIGSAPLPSPTTSASTPILLNRLFAVGTAPGPTPYNELSVLIFQLVELNPRNLEILKPALRILLADRLRSDLPKDAIETKEKFFDVVLKLAAAVAPEDLLVSEMLLNQDLLKNQLEAGKRRATELHKKFPLSIIGPYYLAWVGFLENDNVTTEYWLRQSFARSPLDPRVRQSLRLFLSGVKDKTRSAEVFRPDAMTVSVRFEIRSAEDAQLTATLGFPLLKGFEVEADLDRKIEGALRNSLQQGGRPWELAPAALKALLTPK